ncbi:MAG: MT-A70 family methyltransferase [Lacinutrix sp.]|uniref:MT-A70 family methyltransferase n=1 Tax=Lacinutrix sp. TaxID=1937692 RepID=UPI003095188E
MEIKEEFKNLIPALSVEEYAQLEANILEEGIREPIITWNGFIIDGHNRFSIAQRFDLEYKTTSKHFSNENLVKIWMLDNQFGKRNLTDAQRYLNRNEKRKLLKAQGKLTQGERTDLLSTIDKKLESKHNTQKIIADELGWSTGKVAMADVVFKKATPEVIEKVNKSEVSINAAYKEIKKEEKKEERDKKIQEVKQKIETENLTTLDKKYHVIAIDPPWAYNEKGGFSSDDYDAQNNRGAVDYPTMTVEQIKKIEIPAANDSVLFLWTTHAFLRDSFDIMKEWGFEYKATIVWDKVKMGMGRNVRMQVEFCLLGIKGKPIIQGSSERDIITEPRREHSRKPEAFYEMVERMCIGNKLDYFSRQTRKNWEHYGAEQGQF